jgi:hypothetical protein
MRKIVWVAFTLSIFLSLTIIQSAASPLIGIASSGKIYYPNSLSTGQINPDSETTGQIKILKQSYQNGLDAASDIASSVDVYQAHYDALYRVFEIRAANPNMMFFVYYNSIHVWRSGAKEYDAKKLQSFIDNEWVLKDKNGNYVTAYNGYAYYVDFGNSAFQTWLANWFKKYIDEYSLNGASIDNWFCESSVWYYVDGPTSVVNPRTGVTWTDQQICDAFKSLTLKVKQTIGSDKIVLVNGVYNGNHFYMSSRNKYYVDGLQNGGVDAVISEGWISSYDASVWYTEEIWKKSIDFTVWLEKNWLRGKYFMQISTDNSWWTSRNYPADMTQQCYEQFVTFCYASRLLSVERLSSLACFGYYIYENYPKKLFTIDIGTPTEAYDLQGSTHVYQRTFTNGIVLVNPTSTVYTVAVGLGFADAVTGTEVSELLTIQPHTGIILKNN